MVLLILGVLISIVFSLPFVQTRIARYATDSINEEFGTTITIERVKFSPFTMSADIKGIYVEDYKQDTLIAIHKLSTSILSVQNMINGSLEFGDIEVDRLYFNMKTYKGETGTNLDVFVDKLDDGKPKTPGSQPFFMSSSEITMSESRFKLSDENLESPTVLNLNELEVSASDFQILGREVLFDIDNLSLHSKRGLNIKDLATDFKYTREQMRFDALAIETDESKLNGSLVFDYDREDFKEFLDKVKVTAEFSESRVAFNEINTYFNEFGTGITALFSTKVEGVLNNLEVKDLILRSDNTGIRGDFKFKNLFRQTEPFVMNADMDNMTSSYYQLRSLLPNILGKNIPTSFQKFGQFTVRGKVEVTETSIDAQVNLNTAIGSSYSDLQMTNINNIDDASYRGLISLTDFDLGDYIDDPQFGKTSLDVNVEGRGFTAEYLNTEAIGEIYKLQFNNYEYTNVKVSGILKDELFDGNLICNDENLRFDFEGLADFSAERNNFNFSADVDYADLKIMNFINDSISIFKGEVKMNISGNSLDNITGDVRFEDTTYQNVNDIYFFEDFAISSSFEKDAVRNLKIESPDIVSGYLKGKYKVAELGKLLQNSMGSIYTNYKPYEVSPGQRLSFNFKIYNKFIGVFFPEVNLGPETFIRGNILADEGDFKLTFKSPAIEAYKNELENVELQIDNKNALFNTFLSIDNLSTVYYNVKEFNLINTKLKDTLFFRTEFSGGSKYNDTYNLNFYHTFNKENKSVIGLKKSDVSFKDNKWVINRDGNAKNKIILNKSLDSITIEEIVMNNNKEEQIRLKGAIADSTYKDLDLQFKIVSLDKITPEIDSLKLAGQVDGFLNILQKDGKYLPTSSLNIKDFAVNRIPLGDLEMMIFGNNDLTEYGVNTWLRKDGVEKMNVNGKIYDGKTETIFDLSSKFKDFNLEPFAPLGEEILSNIRGQLSGEAKITGNARNPNIDGELVLNNAGMGIPYLNVDYDFAPKSRIRLSDQSFNLENVLLTDVAESTQGTLYGSISHTSFDDWVLDLNLDTNNDRFLILDTDYNEDALYYGTGFVNGTGSISGSTNALNINFEGSTARGSSLKIPLSDLTTVGDYSFINFIDKNKTRTFEEERSLDDYQGIEMSFDLDVTPDAEVEIVIDQNSGSSLKGTGAGLLLMEINTNGKFNMYGEFAVVTGEYNFKRAGLIDKKFSVRPGGRVIWQGDPLKATLNMEAVYALNANPAPLLDGNNSTGRISTEVVIKLNGELENPQIDFDIEFPGTNSVVQSELEYRLQDPTIKSDNAFFLLAQGTFVNQETSGLNQQALTGNLLQTASGLLNQVLTGDNDKLNLGLSYEQGYSDQADLRADNRIGVTLSTQISDRILINGRVGVPVGGVSETVVAGDVEVQVLLNDEGTLSAKIFNRENQIQQFLGERQGYTQGLGLSYQVDFDTFRELLQKVFKKKDEEVEKPKEKEVSKPTNVIGKDSLVTFYTKKKLPKR